MVTDEAHVPVWGTQIITTDLNDRYAKVTQSTSWEMPEGKSMSDYVIETSIVDPSGKTITTDRMRGSNFDHNTFNQEFVVEQPAVWTPETPNLYTRCRRSMKATN